MNLLAEAFAAILVRDVLLAAIVGGIVAAIAYAVTRLPKLSATSRHAVWTLAILAIGVMPLAAIGRSIATRHEVPRVAAPDATQVRNDLAAQSAPRRASERQSSVRVPQVSVRGPQVSEHGQQASAQGHEIFATAGPTSPNDRSRSLPRTPILADSSEQRHIFSFLEIRTLVSALPTLPIEASLALLGAWMLGAAIGLGFLCASLVRVSGLKRRSSPITGELSDELPWLVAGEGREIMLRLSFEIETPVAVGFRRPVVLIPTEFTDAQGLGNIEELVQHEYAHLRRYDDWTNLAQRIVERIFWWNPVVHLVGRRIALEREIAADDHVVASGAAPQRYAQSLWRLAREMRMPEHASVAPGAFFTRKQISIRIERLLDESRNALPRLSPGAAWIAFCFALVGVGAVVGIAPGLELARDDVSKAGELPAATSHTATLAVRATPHASARQTSIPLAARSAFVKESNATAKRQSEHASSTPAAVALVQTAPRSTVALTASASPSSTLLPSAASATAAPYPTAPPYPPEPSAALARAERAMRKAQAALAAEKAAGRSPEIDAFVDAKVREALSAASVSFSRSASRNASRSSADPQSVPSVSAPQARPALAAPPALPALPPTASAERSGLAELFAHCVGCNLGGRPLRHADLHGLNLVGANLAGADLRDANLQGAKLSGVNLSSAKLDGARLQNAQLVGVNLNGASLRYAQVEGLKVSGSTFEDADFHGTSMRSFIEGCYGCAFKDFNFARADLHGLSAHGLDFTEGNFAYADLRGGSFSGSNFTEANFANADLRDADFTGCNLDNANFRGAKVSGARFPGGRPPDSL